MPDTVSTEMHLIGELDVAAAQVLDTLIDQQIATGPLEVRLDVAELGFCDVVGVRALLRAGRRLSAAGGQLVLLRPAPLLVRVAELCGWSAELGLPAEVVTSVAGGAARRPERSIP